MTAPDELHVCTAFGSLTALAWGPADAPPLLALHGWLDNAASYAGLAPYLIDQRRVIALDMPGHGHSDHLPPQTRRYHIVDQVDHVLDVADALGLDQFDLLGHSLGAGIASLTAAAAPDRIKHLLLIEGLGPLADDGTNTLDRWRKAHRQRQRANGKPRTFVSIDEAISARIAVDGLQPDEVRPIVERNLQATDGGFTWRSDSRLRRPTLLRTDETQVRRLLVGIQAPTLLMLSKPATPYLPPAQLRERADQVREIRVEHIDGPHHLHLRHPRQVAECVSGFM
ncbi:MAG TPA: alpha/beta hydrolase [Oleiagrimonas sp.]|nr:alpha/beta hydrolase [Oleiagrimonas sp.]